jgi:hypothetical protein
MLNGCRSRGDDLDQGDVRRTCASCTPSVANFDRAPKRGGIDMTAVSGLCLGLLLAVLVPLVASCEGAHDHQVTADLEGSAHAHDDHHDHALHPLSLDRDGRPWPTDAALREGMQRIRDAVILATAEHERSGHDAERDIELANAVDEAVAFLFANCRLEPEADANLHLLLARIMAASAALRADSETGEGLVGLLAALDDYPRYFDHPAWETVPHVHH